MKSLSMWKVLLVNWWIHFGFMPGLYCNTRIINHLSKDDVLLLKADKNVVKCFTRTEEDFTCFFETTDNKTYDIFYQHVRQPMKRCSMTIQRTEEGASLHVCQFPSSDVYTYSYIDIQLVERSTNISVHNRSAFVENNFLLDPPTHVSLNPNGKVGELQVSWQTKYLQFYEHKKIYRIQHSHEEKPLELCSPETEKPNVVRNSRNYQDSWRVEEGLIFKLYTDAWTNTANGNILKLPSSEIVEVQVAVKVGKGHWSSWSEPVKAAVPQSAGDISLTCYTSDLLNVGCEWKGQTFGVENEYKLFYKMDLRGPSNWGDWTECLAKESLTDQCYFHGNDSSRIRVKLSGISALLNRTFYHAEFMLNNIVKPFPPHHLKYQFRQDEVCLEWEAPLPSLQSYLQYEVDIQTEGGKQWTRIINSDTKICEQVPLGSLFRTKIRSKPNGTKYSGSWSDWSDVLTDHIPPDLGVQPTFSDMLYKWVVVVTSVTATISVCIYGLCYSKLKQYFWPPVPNLEKVLQGLLTEINKQKWDSEVTAKQGFEETTLSVVEIISEDEVPSSEKLSGEYSELLSSDGSFSSGQLTIGSSGTEVFPDYVTLNQEIAISCLEGNSYVIELNSKKRNTDVEDECLQICSCSFIGSSSHGKLYSDFTNHCYLLTTQSTNRFSCMIHGEKGPGNLYTNLPCS